MGYYAKLNTNSKPMKEKTSYAVLYAVLYALRPWRRASASRSLP